MLPNSCRRSGTCAMPARTMAGVGRRAIDAPVEADVAAGDAAPAPMTVLSSVLLPAPLAPISATISPAPHARATPRAAPACGRIRCDDAIEFKQRAHATSCPR